MGLSNLEVIHRDIAERLAEEVDWVASVWDSGPEEHELFVFWERWLQAGFAEAIEKGLVY